MSIFLNHDDECTNALEEAIAVLGGVIEASSTLRISNSAVYHLLRQGIVRNADTAFALEEATAAKGCRVPARELAKRDPWEGPGRHPNAPRRKRRPQESTSRANGKGAAPRQAGAQPVAGPRRRRRSASHSAPARNRTWTYGAPLTLVDRPEPHARHAA